jgi:hypothetical protein
MDSDTRNSKAGSFTFQFTVKKGEWLQVEPDKVLLGRNIRYVLNIKLLEGGQAVAGKKYFLTSTNPPIRLLTMTGLNETHMSTAEGNDFPLFAYPAEVASDHAAMERELSLVATMESTGEAATAIYKIGRLAKWLPPSVVRAKWGDTTLWFDSELLGEGGSGINWNWGQTPDRSFMKIDWYEERAWTRSGFAEMKVTHSINAQTLDDLGIKPGDKFEVSFHENVTGNGYSAIIPISYEVILPDTPAEPL